VTSYIKYYNSWVSDFLHKVLQLVIVITEKTLELQQNDIHKHPQDFTPRDEKRRES